MIVLSYASETRSSSATAPRIARSICAGSWMARASTYPPSTIPIRLTARSSESRSNRATRAAPSICSFSWTEVDPSSATVRHVRGTGMARALAEIAIDAIDTVCGERAKRLLECEAPGCVRLLERKHARRRWCSTACGDRVRAAYYYARHRSDPAL